MSQPNIPNTDWLDDVLRPLHQPYCDKFAYGVTRCNCDVVEVKAAILSKLKATAQTAYKQALYDSGYPWVGKVESVEERLEGMDK